MTNLTAHFTDKSKKLDMLKDSFTVMFADTRHGMDAKTREAFDHIKARAAGDTRVAKYVAKIELSIGKRMPHALQHAPRI